MATGLENDFNLDRCGGLERFDTPCYKSVSALMRNELGGFTKSGSLSFRFGIFAFILLLLVHDM